MFSLMENPFGGNMPAGIPLPRQAKRFRGEASDERAQRTHCRLLTVTARDETGLSSEALANTPLFGYTYHGEHYVTTMWGLNAFICVLANQGETSFNYTTIVYYGVGETKTARGNGVSMFNVRYAGHGKITLPRASGIGDSFCLHFFLKEVALGSVRAVIEAAPSATPVVSRVADPATPVRVMVYDFGMPPASAWWSAFAGIVAPDPSSMGATAPIEHVACTPISKIARTTMDLAAI